MWGYSAALYCAALYPKCVWKKINEKYLTTKNEENERF